MKFRTAQKILLKHGALEFTFGENLLFWRDGDFYRWAFGAIFKGKNPIVSTLLCSKGKELVDDLEGANNGSE